MSLPPLGLALNPASLGFLLWELLSYSLACPWSFNLYHSRHPMQISRGLFLHSFLLSVVLLCNFQPPQPPRTLISVSVQENCSVCALICVGPPCSSLLSVLYLQAESQGSCSNQFVFLLLRISLECLFSNVENSFFMYSVQFLAVYSKREGLATVSLVWLRAKSLLTYTYTCVCLYFFRHARLFSFYFLLKCSWHTGLY